MYFVDQRKIQQTLTFVDGLLENFETHDFETDVEKLGLERLAHLLIESMIDVGNMMIDGFIMRDPGSYEDIIDILVDEKVIPKEDETPYKKLIQIRPLIVINYLSIDHERIKQTLKNHLKVYKAFSQHVRQYLEKELGVANTFYNINSR